MPLATTAAQNAALDAVVGTFPATGATYRLYTDVPALATELASAGGYAPVAFVPAGWAAAVDGAKSTTAAVSFGTSTDAWSDVATYWAIADAAGNPLYFDLLPEQIAVGASGTAVSFQPALYFRNEL